MPLKIRRSAEARHDLRLIVRLRRDLLLDMGHTHAEARAEVSRHMTRLNRDLAALANAPCQGTLDQIAGLRHVTRHRIVIYFMVDEQAELLRVLGLFSSRQDHAWRMLRRLLVVRGGAVDESK